MKCRIWALSALLIATPSLAAPSVDYPIPPNPCLSENAWFSLRLARLEPEGLAASSNAEATALPKNQLKRPKTFIPQGCARPFLYRGELYTVDSPQAEDAGTLKFFTKSSPDAFKYLSEYQNNRLKSKISAYTGTAGVLLVVFSSGIGRWLAPRNPDTVREIALLFGAAVAVEGVSYSLMMLRQNEVLLNRAVDSYNHDQPKDPVELQFSTGWSF
jgi:hypothetical protein